jgi:hypothetical protein
MERKCSKCDRPAKYYWRDGSTMFYACADVPEHADPVGKWKNVDAMGGSLVKIEENAAKIKKDILG